MIQLDVTIVNVALSRISADLGPTVAELQWVVDAYTLGFAALLLSAGVVGDQLGPKRVFVAGFVGFAAASLALGPGFLNATRAIQGIGAALLVPSSLAILNDACAHDLRLRARAIGIWTAAGGAAIAAGPVVGGLLLTGLGWRSIFLVNIPICAFGLGLTLRFVPPMTTAILSSVDRARSGTASAVLNAARQVGAAIGVAAFGAMVSGVAPAQKMIAANNRMKTIAGTVFEYAASIAAPAQIISVTAGTMVEMFPGCVLIRDCSEMTCQIRC